MHDWTEITALLACLLVMAPAAGCLGYGESLEEASAPPAAEDAKDPQPDGPWKTIWNETGTIEEGVGLGWGTGGWNGDEGRFDVSVEDGTDRLTVHVFAPRVNTSSNGAGHVLFYVETPSGSYLAPEGTTLVPTTEDREPLAVTPVPPPETQELTVQDPETGGWTVKVGPSGPVVSTTYEVTVIQQGGS